MVAVLIGPTGAGKTSLALRLAAELSLIRLSSGDLLRSILRENSPAGENARRCAAAELPADEAAITVVMAALDRVAPGQRVLLDGFPRSMKQVTALDRQLSLLGGAISVVLQVQVTEDTALRRLSHRRVCPLCDAIFPARQEISPNCDGCGAALVRRSGDDQPAVLRRRRIFYCRDTVPVVEHYRQLGSLVDLDGEGKEEEVYRWARERVIAALTTTARRCAARAQYYSREL